MHKRYHMQAIDRTYLDRMTQPLLWVAVFALGIAMCGPY